MISTRKNLSCPYKGAEKKQIIMYIKGTSSNIFISLFKKATVNKSNNNLHLYRILRTFSCGNFKPNIGRKVSLFSVNKLVLNSFLYLKEEEINSIHIIINNISAVIKYILYRILDVNYKNKGVKLLSLIDLTHYSYTKHKIKKDKRR